MGLESGAACAGLGLGLLQFCWRGSPARQDPPQKSVVTETIFDFRQTHSAVHSVSKCLPYVRCKFLEFWQQSFMAFKAYLKVDNDVLLPAVLGLAVVSLTVIALYLLRRRRVATQAGGSRYVTSLDGSQVRRSTRSRKSVARWSPDDLASPTGYGTPKTPKTAVEKIEEKTPAPVKQAKKEASTVAEKVTDKISKMAAPVAEAAATKRGPGRPPKTPAAKTPATKTPVAGSPRQLRSRRTPAK